MLGAGPGGYTAAFRAADLGLDTVLIERFATLGGVCLNVGCIPSKALLHAAAVIDEAAHAKDYGVSFGAPTITLDALRSYKDKVVGQLTKGLATMAKQRKVRVVTGTGRFVSANEIEVTGEAGTQLLRFEHCIIAAGSQALKLPGFPWDDPRVMDSTDALELAEIPKRLLVVGGESEDPDPQTTPELERLTVCLPEKQGAGGIVGTHAVDEEAVNSENVAAAQHFQHHFELGHDNAPVGMGAL